MAQLYGTGNLNPTATRAVTKLLKTIGPIIAMDPFIDTIPVPMNENETWTVSRAVIPDSDLTPSDEGVNKAPRQLFLEQNQKTLDEFEEIYSFSSRQAELGEFDVLKIAKDVLPELVAQTREEYAWSIARAGDNVYYNSSAITARNAVNGPITLGRIDKAIRLLDANRSPKIMEAATGALQQGTVPMPPSYVAFGHTDMLADFRALSQWREAPEVGGMKSKVMAWAGSIRNLAVLLTPHFKPVVNSGAAVGSTGLKTSGTLVDVYPLVIMSKTCFSRLSLKGSGAGGYGGVKINVLKPTDVDKSDPSGKRAYVACRYYDGPLITRQAGIVRLEVGVTDNPA